MASHDVQPYDFEPQYSQAELLTLDINSEGDVTDMEIVNTSSDPERPTDSDTRVGHEASEWCLCAMCISMPTAVESVLL